MLITLDTILATVEAEMTCLFSWWQYWFGRIGNKPNEELGDHHGRVDFQ